MSTALAPLSLYAPRPITFLGLHEAPGATLKVYGIRRASGTPGEALVAAATRVADAYLAAPRAACHAGGVDWAARTQHPLGVLMVHEGREAFFVVLDVWFDENMLRHHVWCAPLASPESLESLAAADVTYCVWELAVIEHERRAWLRHVFTREGRVDREAYLADVMNGEV